MSTLVVFPLMYRTAALKSRHTIIVLFTTHCPSLLYFTGNPELSHNTDFKTRTLSHHRRRTDTPALVVNLKNKNWTYNQLKLLDPVH